MTPIKTVDYVDLERFMGDWYVIAAIPTFLERNIYNPVENYRLTEDGEVATTFTYRKNGFDGPEKTMRPSAVIRDTQTNAHWGMQFIWPFRAEYKIVFLNESYTQTVIGRSKRDYLWIMARQPDMSDEDYNALVELVTDLGYDPAKIKRMPHRWDR